MSPIETLTTANKTPNILIEKPEDFETKLGIRLTFEEKKELEVDFKPFEVAHGEVLKLQDMVNRQAKEKVKTLKELARASKETKEKAGKERKGLAGTLSEKAGEIKDKGMELIEKTKHAAIELGKKVTEKMGPWELAKYTLKMGMFGLQIMFWSALAATGWEWAKNKLHEIEKKKVSETIKAAKEKGLPIPEGLDTEKTETEGSNSETKEVVNQAAPAVLLGGAGLGIFSFIRSKLPASIAKQLDTTTDKKSFLKMLARNKALRLFGIGGLTLFGLGQLSEAAENPAIQSELGEMPGDPEKQKTWLKALIEKSAEIGSETKKALMGFFSEGWDYARGEKLDTYLTKNDETPAEGMVTLGEKLSPFNREADNLLYDTINLAEKLKYPAIGMAIISPLFRSLELSAGVNGAKLAWMITKLIGRNVLGIVLLINMGVLAKHKIHVPEDNEKIGEWLRDIAHLPETQEELKKNNVPDDVIQSISNNTEELENMIKNPENIEKKLSDERNKIIAAAEKEGLKIIAPEREEMLKSKNQEGLDRFEKALKHHLSTSENPQEKAVIEHVKNLHEKINKVGLVTKEDIFELMKICRGTNIRIHKTYYPYIKWVIQDNAGIVKESDILCPDPLEDKETQFHAARKMVLRNDGKIGAIGGIFEVGFSGVRGMLGRMKEAMESNNPQEGANIFEKIYNNKGALVLEAGKFMLYDVAGNALSMPIEFVNNFLKYSKGDITGQEFIVESADGLVPVMIIGTSLNMFTKKSKAVTLISSPLYLLGKGWVDAANLGQYFYKKIHHGHNNIENFLDLLADKKLEIHDRFLRKIECSRNLRYTIGGLFSKNMRDLKSGIRELSIIQQVKRKLELIERKNKSSRGKSTSEIQTMLDEVGKDINAYYEKYHFSTHQRNGHPLDKFCRMSPHTLGQHMADISTLEASANQRNVTMRRTFGQNIQSQAAQARQRLSANPAFKSRIRKYAGVAGIVAALTLPIAASIGADKLNNKESANSSTDDLSESYEETDYQGFEEGIKSEKIDNNAPEMSSVFRTVDDIKDSLLGEENVEKIQPMMNNDVQFFMATSEKELGTLIQDIYPRYESSINRFRKISEENKGILERYFKENPDKQNKEIKVCEFLGVSWKNNVLSLNYMSKEKFERHFYSTFDHVQKNLGSYQDDGHQSGWEKTGEVAKDMTPFVGGWVDAKQAYQDFSRGHIKSGLLNGLVAGVNWVGDGFMAAGLLTSWTGIGAGVGLGGGGLIKAGAAGLKGFLKAGRYIEIGQQIYQGIDLVIEKDISEKL